MTTPSAAADDLDAGSEPTVAMRARPRLLDVVARHWIFGLVLGIGILVRVLTMVSYWPGFWFPDTTAYFYSAERMRISELRPYGYSAFLNLLQWSDQIWLITTLQHLMGIGIGVGIYALVIRRGIHRWLGVLASIPILWDAFGIDVEHYLLADTLFTALLFGGVLCLLWQDRITVPLAIGAGLLFGMAAATRTVGLPIAAVCVLYILVRRSGWRPVLSSVVALALPLVVYLVAYQQVHGVYAFGQWQGRFLYARVMAFADCDKIDDLTTTERQLCDSRPVEARPPLNFYIWNRESPGAKFPGKAGDPILQSFAKKAILAQPGDYAATVGRETVAFFAPGRVQPRGTICANLWTFPYDKPWPGCEPMPVAGDGFNVKAGERPAAWPGFAKYLNGYANVGYTPGPLLAIFVLLSLLAIVVRPRAGHWRDRIDILFLTGVGLCLMVVAVATSQFDYRYGVPALAFIPVGGAFAIAVLSRTLRRTRTAPAEPME